MRSRATLAAVALMAGVAAVFLGQTAAPTPTPKPAAAPASPAAHPTAAAAAAAASELPKCADCHEAQVKAFASNPHARSHGPAAPDPEEACSTCHGDGTAHIESSGDPTKIMTFHGLEGAENCLSCHSKSNPHGSFAFGFHANSAAVNCLSCHSIHATGTGPRAEHLLAKDTGALCQTCHTGIAASFRNKPYAHRLDKGGMTCVDCHDPHDRKGQPVKLTSDGELACMSCHAEKRGPFVFDHVTGSAGNCLTCHEAHGSSNPKQLIWARVDQLCLSCHSKSGGPRTAGGQPPSFHDLSLPRYRNCTTCHVAIHGSNLSEAFLK
ncbi:MAG TPA: cytochrome c3 family protein [Thermoanaerobaculia bacterium]